MTCIVGITRDGSVHMGADSCGSDDWSCTNVTNPKIFINGEFLIGGAGSFRLIDLLRFSLVVPAQSEKISDDAYMRTIFITRVRKLLEENGYNQNNNEAGEFIVGYHGRLYSVQEDHAILNVPDWGYAIGLGEGAARGSLWTTRANPDIDHRLQIALEAAEVTTLSVRGPFVFAKN